MKTQHKNFRFSILEIKTLKQLAKASGMSESEYIKNKLFDQNEDLIEGGDKFIAPDNRKQGYVLAFSLVKLNFVLQELMSKHGFMTHKEYDEFCGKKTIKIREAISNLGFKRIMKEDE